MMPSAEENRQSSNHKQKKHDERGDIVSPAWRQLWEGHFWPSWRLDRVTLDELLRLQKAAPFLQRAIDDAVERKLRATP